MSNYSVHNSQSSTTRGRKKQKPAFDVVVFDIDNVLVDTRTSYLDAIRWTIELYLTKGKIPFFESKVKSKTPRILTIEDVETFKLLGGFNDDWDCCYGLLIYILSLPVKKRTVESLKKHIKIKSFVDSVKKRPLGVSGIVNLIGRQQQITIERISRIFQEIYLGKELFESVERLPAIHWKKRGLITKERLVFKKSILKKLKDMGVKLAIATGRSRFEATYTLRHFSVLDFFNHLTTMDEVRKAEQSAKKSLRKPHPFSLVFTAQHLGLDKSYIYIGDLPDDVLCAKKAASEIQVKSAAYPILYSPKTSYHEEIKKSSPDFILSDTKEILDLVKKGTLES